MHHYVIWVIPWINSPYWKEFALNILWYMRFKNFQVVTPCNTWQILVENKLLASEI